jgi:hypothetical protein
MPWGSLARKPFIIGGPRGSGLVRHGPQLCFPRSTASFQSWWLALAFGAAGTLKDGRLLDSDPRLGSTFSRNALWQAGAHCVMLLGSLVDHRKQKRPALRDGATASSTW